MESIQCLPVKVDRKYYWLEICAHVPDCAFNFYLFIIYCCCAIYPGQNEFSCLFVLFYKVKMELWK